MLLCLQGGTVCVEGGGAADEECKGAAAEKEGILAVEDVFEGGETAIMLVFMGVDSRVFK